MVFQLGDYGDSSVESASLSRVKARVFLPLHPCSCTLGSIGSPHAVLVVTKPVTSV